MEANWFYNSSNIKKLSYGLSGVAGQYFVGTRLNYNLNLTLRTRPWGEFSLSVNENRIWMKQQAQDVSLLLIGASTKLSFTKKLFFTTFLQYNTQAENFNINARLQYRFKPMSDLYIVYTSNYYATNIDIKDRALVVKLIYWINL